MENITNNSPCGRKQYNLISDKLSELREITQDVNQQFNESCKRGWLDVIQYIIKNDTTNDICMIGSHFHEACINGQLETAKWLYDNYKEDIETEGFYSGARSTGYKYVTAEDLSVYYLSFIDSCINGHLDVIKWLYSTFSLRDELINTHHDIHYIYVCVNQANQTEVLRWLNTILDVM